MVFFISSTCTDLKDLRAEIAEFLKSRGHTPLLSEDESFPIESNKSPQEICISNVAKCDWYVLVINERYGSTYRADPRISVTWAEFREAVRTERQILVFVQVHTKMLYEIWKTNKWDTEGRIQFGRDVRLFDFIDEVESLVKEKSWIQRFENSVQVKKRLQALLTTTNSSSEIQIGAPQSGEATDLDVSDVLIEETHYGAAIEVIFTDTAKRKPILSKSCKFNGNPIIIGIYEKEIQGLGRTQHLCILNQYLGTWRITHTEALDKEGCYPSTTEVAYFSAHDGKLYFYFERLIQDLGNAFQGLGTVEFSVFDFESKTITSLCYSGSLRGETVEGEFNFEQQKTTSHSPFCEELLVQGVSASPYVYRTPKDYNLDAKENCIERWEIENPDFYSNEVGRLHFFTYNEDIFWSVDTYGSVEAFRASSREVENDFYTLQFCFSGPILAMRKSDSMYFVVLVPQAYGGGGAWGLRSIASIEFLDDHLILAKNAFESYEIDLNMGMYERRSI